MNKTFRVASIYESWVTDYDDFNTINYKEAYEFAQNRMNKDKMIVSCLIYSSKGTAIVLKRKWAENENK